MILYAHMPTAESMHRDGGGGAKGMMADDA